MSQIKNFYDLDAWKVSYKFVLDMYEITKGFPNEELYCITIQIRRAVNSITANIAEGFERYYYKDKIRFYYHARSSVAEVQSFIYTSRGLGYINEPIFERMLVKSKKVIKLINGLINSIQKQM